jgi:hypothetical protein
MSSAQPSSPASPAYSTSSRKPSAGPSILSRPAPAASFVTPTELEQNGAVSTLQLWRPRRRARDRVLSLLAFYQNEATDQVDFAALAAQAAAVTETARSIRFNSGQTRRSVRNRNVHSIGGFEGWAECSGPLDALTPT